MGQKLVLTEFIAYGNLAAVGETVSDRTATIAAYALCGFANFASIGINWRNWFNCTKRKKI